MVRGAGNCSMIGIDSSELPEWATTSIGWVNIVLLENCSKIIKTRYASVLGWGIYSSTQALTDIHTCSEKHIKALILPTPGIQCKKRMVR